MFPEGKIIEIFSICDDFSKVFDKTVEQNAITGGDSSKKRKYHRDGLMSDSEVMTILILFHNSGYRCLSTSNFIMCVGICAIFFLKWCLTIDSLNCFFLKKPMLQLDRELDNQLTIF